MSEDKDEKWIFHVGDGEWRGMGNASRYMYKERCVQPKQYAPVLYFPVHKPWIYEWVITCDDYKHVVDFRDVLDEDSDNMLWEKIVNTLKPALYELYLKARFNKETKTIYKKQMRPHIKLLWEKFADIYKTLDDESEHELKKKQIKDNLYESIDDIVTYVKAIQRPVDAVIDYHEDLEKSKEVLKEQEDIIKGKFIEEHPVDDIFADIKMNNKLRY